MVLALQPSLLFLDEPTAGMSSAERQATVQLLRKVKQERRLAMLLTEHDMDVVFGLADRISVLHYGELIASGAPDAIRNDPRVREVYLGDEMTHMLEVRDLHARYGDSYGLFGLNLKVPAGGGVALLGRNGAGKSTLLKAVLDAGPTVHRPDPVAGPLAGRTGHRSPGAPGPHAGARGPPHLHQPDGAAEPRAGASRTRRRAARP